MVAFSKVVGVLSCGYLLCLGLANIASSAENLNTGQSGYKNLFTVGIKTALNPVRRSRATWCASKVRLSFVREASGNEVRMHVDATTEKNQH